MSSTLHRYLAGATLALLLAAVVQARPDDTPKKKGEVTKFDKAQKKNKAVSSTHTVPLTSTDLSKPVELKEKSEPGKRSKEQLEKALAQFQVDTNPRYKPRGGATF